MRVVIDTNVFISSFIGEGNPKKIINLWKLGQLTLYLSRSIIDEYVEVLQRLGLADEDELAELLHLFGRGYNCIFTAKTIKLEIVENDPDDNMFFECAVALNAKYIISGDKAVLEIGQYMEIKVCTPKNFMQEVLL